MKTKQNKLSKHLGISDPYLSLLLKGERPISWPLAQKLSEIFPDKDIMAWKDASPLEFKAALSELHIPEQEAAE